MSLYLDANVVISVELHDARVVFEDADAPVVVTQAAANLLGGAKNRLLEKVVDASSVVVDLPLEGLV